MRVHALGKRAQGAQQCRAARTGVLAAQDHNNTVSVASTEAEHAQGAVHCYRLTGEDVGCAGKACWQCATLAANNSSSESAYNRTTSQCMLGELLNAQRGSNNMQPGGRVAWSWVTGGG